MAQGEARRREDTPDYGRFYAELFAPLEAALGPIDRDTLMGIIGFDLGGPLSFCTIGRKPGAEFITYVSCELAVRDEQRPSRFGRYELLASCDNEDWVRTVVSDIGRMSLEVTFDDQHTLDIGPWVEPDTPIQGVMFERACTAVVDGESYGVLRVIGVSRAELLYTQKRGVPALISKLKSETIYPNTVIGRASVV